MGGSRPPLPPLSAKNQKLALQIYSYSYLREKLLFADHWTLHVAEFLIAVEAPYRIIIVGVMLVVVRSDTEPVFLLMTNIPMINIQRGNN